MENGQRFLFISYDQSRYSHGIHKYPAKFFPELPRWLVQKYSKVGDVVLDPFMGSATTNIECLLNERNSVGIDVDPFARFQDDFKERRLNTASICQTKIVLCASDRAGRAIYVGKLNAGHEVDFKRFKEA